MQVVCCIASGGIVRGVFLPSPPPQPTTEKRPPSNAAGPFDIGGSVQRRDDAIAAVRFRSPKISREMKIYLYKTSFSVASLYYPSVRNAVVDLENRSDSDTIFFSKPSKAPIAIIIWLSVHKIHARTLHIETMSSIILFILKRLKMKKKKSILDKLFITLKKWFLRTSLSGCYGLEQHFGHLLSLTADGNLS